jgi:hypothetical protein
MAILISLISFVSAAMYHPDVSTSLHRRAGTNPVLPGNSGQLPRHDAAAVNGLIHLSAQQTLPVTIPPSALHILPENLIIGLPFKEAMNLADKRLTEQDIITHCDKSNAQEIIAYIFRDLGSTDHGSTDEVRLKNLRILLNSEQVQEQIQKDNMAAVHNRQILNSPRLNQMVSGHLKHHLLLDSLQAAVNDMARNGKSFLLRELLESFSREFSEVRIPLKAIFIAAKKGDSSTVYWILGKVKVKDMMRIFSDISYYDDYVQNALKGAISGIQFDTFKRIINISDSRVVQSFSKVLVRDLLNKNLRSWLDYVLSSTRYTIDKEKSIAFYVKRSTLNGGNPVKPSKENVQYLMNLPDNYQINLKSFVSIMYYADSSILEHLARQLLDARIRFKVEEHVEEGFVQRFVSGLEALNDAIGLVNGLSTARYKNVLAALIKVKGEFDPLPIEYFQKNPIVNADLVDFLRNTYWNS